MGCKLREKSESSRRSRERGRRRERGPILDIFVKMGDLWWEAALGIGGDI